MKFFVSLIVGMVIGGAAVNSLAAAQGAFDVFQFVDRDAYVKKYPADAKSTYLEGLADAISYIHPKDAIGPDVSKCLKDSEVTSIFRFYAPMNDFINQAPPEEPIVATFLNLLRQACAGYLK